MYSIDKDVLADYNKGIEKDRLHSGLGLIEFERTCELLDEFLPKPPAVVYDIGGGYGEYSWLLASKGYDVSLFDISETNIEMSKELSQKYKSTKLIKAEVSDARSIKEADSSADAILFMGPLYHITDLNERIKALKEAFRLLKPGGLLFCAAITRYSYLLWATTTYGLTNDLLGESEAKAMISRDLYDGQHIRHPKYTGIGRSFFHLPNELKAELETAKFTDIDIRGVVGPAWLVPHLDEQWKDSVRKENIMNIVRLTEKEESLLGLSTHLLAIAKKD